MTARHTEQPTPTLADRLRRQRDRLAELETLATRQGELLDEADAADLLALLAERQRLVDEIVSIGRAVERDLPRAGPPDAEVADLLAEVEALAARIAERDDAHRQRLERRRDELGAEMAGVGRGRTAVAAYATRARQPRTRFKDTEA